MSGDGMSTTRELAELELARHDTDVAWLLRHVHEKPQSVAIRFLGEDITWADLGARVQATAARLHALGVGPDDRVAVLLPNRPEFVVVCLAAHQLGAIVVPLNFRLAPPEVAFLVGNSEAAVLVTDATLLPTAQAAAAEAGTGTPLVSVDPREDGGESWSDATGARPGGVDPTAAQQAPLAVRTLLDDAAIMYTSGTTGRPKGAVLTHGNLHLAGTRTMHTWSLTDTDVEHVVMVGSPLFHIAAYCVWQASLCAGVTMLVMPSTAFDPAQVLDTIERERVTETFLVPAQWQALCAVPGVAERDLPLRVLVWGAAPATEALLRRMMEVFPGADVFAAFGQTETTAMGVSLGSAESLRKIGSVGLPVPQFAVRVVDSLMEDVGVDEVGEIVYRGAGVMSRYWRNEAATAEAFRGGWFHSGDLVRRDAEGFLYVVDRVKDMIISGGENIYCAELENVIADHPQVGQVAVVGRPDERWGEVPVAMVIPADPADPPSIESLREFCDGRLARYKMPREVVVLEDFPRSGTGKVQKNVLRTMV